MSKGPWYRRVMSGEAGPWTVPVRYGLWLAARVYQWGVQARNARYDRHPERSIRLGVPVVSVGNLTTGGTGKTPLVLHLVGLLRERGRRPAVVSRGYKAAGGETADELRLVRRRCQEAICVAEADRVAGGRRAIALGADVIVLDDGFQHRRVHRELDIVVIDATCPFGYGDVLPRGLLREPVAGLRRADLVVLSRVDQVEPEQVTRTVARVQAYHPGVAVIQSRHRATHLAGLDGGTEGLESLAERKVVCLSGIGNPAAFERTVREQGAVVLGGLRLSDHAGYDARRRARIVERLRQWPAAEWLVTTEKDLVKMRPEMWSDLPVAVRALAVEMGFVSDGERVLRAALGRLPGLAPA